MYSYRRAVVSASLGMVLILGVGVPAYATGDTSDDVEQTAELAELAEFIEFDLDGDGLLDLLDLDGDGIPDAEDWDHDGIPDEIVDPEPDKKDDKASESDEGSASSGKEEAAQTGDDSSPADSGTSSEGDGSQGADEGDKPSGGDQGAKADDESPADGSKADGDDKGDADKEASDGKDSEQGDKSGDEADAKDSEEASKADKEADTEDAASQKDAKDDEDASDDESSKADKADAAEDAEDAAAPEDDDALGAKAVSESIAADQLVAAQMTLNEEDRDDAEAIGDTVRPDISSFVRLPSRSYDFTTAKFIATIGEQARQIAQKNDLYASVLIAQAVVESGNGNSLLAQSPNNNLFGIKGSYNGQSVSMPTQEDDGTGRHYSIVADFRRYDTHAESIADYADLLTSHPEWYKGAYKSNAKTYVDACKALQGTYATSTTYAATLVSVIEGFGLDRYDKPLDYKVTGEVHDPQSKKADGDGNRTLTMDDYARLEALATSFIGTDYVWGGSTPASGFDCSGLVQWCMREALGIELPRVTYTQQLVGESVRVDADELRMGDLLFFNIPGEGVGHVAMYLGDGFYIHAPETGDVIKVTSIEEFTPSFARRVINEVDL